ncbi:MAG: dCTP deaminase [Gammaproteobacteria bacterium]|nr:dCTP deaminase [Gammaproteobacteria bacterium]MCP5136379.1 dCTP deaminase [Gammaproteobacteria bacterium]
MLSKSQIIERLKNRELIVSPVLSNAQFGNASVDIRIGTVVSFVRARGISHVSPARHGPGSPNNVYDKEFGLRQKMERHEVPFRSPFLLHPGTLALVPTLEWFVLSNDLMGVVTARSTWAREGLSIATANFIQPGYAGIITLELANLGRVPIELYPGLRVAQIAFYEARPGKDEHLTERTGTFHMSFDPKHGDIAKGDEAFLPLPPSSSGDASTK